jgi:hypothetical protein
VCLALLFPPHKRSLRLLLQRPQMLGAVVDRVVWRSLKKPAVVWLHLGGRSANALLSAVMGRLLRNGVCQHD